MHKEIGLISTFLFLLAACGTATPQALPTATSIASTIAPINTLSPTPIPSITPTIYTPPPTPTPVPTNAANPDFVRDNTPVPQPVEIISPDNVDKIVELARWGNGFIYTLRLSKDGSRVAVATSQGVFFYETGNYTLSGVTWFDLDDGEYAFSPSTKQLARGGGGEVTIYDSETGEVLQTIPAFEHEFIALAYSPNGALLFTSGGDINQPDATKVWDTSNWALLEFFPLNARAITFSSDGSTAAAVGLNNEITAWKVGRYENSIQFKLPDLFGEYAEFSSVGLSSDGEVVVAGTGNYMGLYGWDFSSGELIFGIDVDAVFFSIGGGKLTKPMEFSEGPGPFTVPAVAFISEEEVAITTGLGKLLVWNIKTEKLVQDVSVGKPGLAYLTGAEHLLAWGESAFEVIQVSDLRIVHWVGDFSHSPVVYKNYFSEDPYTRMNFSPGGHLLLYGSDIYDLNAGKMILTSPMEMLLRFAEDGNSVIAYSRSDRAITYTSLSDGKTIQVIPITEPPGEEFWTVDSIDNIILSPQEDLMATFDERVRIWDLGSGAFIEPIDEYAEFLKFSPRGKYLAISSGVGRTAIYATENWEPVLQYDNFVYGFAFSKDEELLAIGNRKEIFVWEIDSQEIVFQTQGNIDWGLDTLAFSPDARLLASVSWSGITLWDVQTAAPFLQLHGHTNTVNNIAFSPDGRYLVSGSQDGTVRLWGIKRE
ncbi:MAG: WD40 repeat domain-containing protein [Anaerolineales bacterium]|nr:WD40 repeat domain-containing protein [Anaerolineales bacterium]